MFTPAEVEMGDHTYRVGRLDAMRQLHVVRRVAPILTKTGVSLAAATSGFTLAKVGAAEDKDAPQDESTLMITVMDAAMKVVAEMTDEDFEYVVKSCLSVVSRFDSDKWVPVMTKQGFQYQDMDMPSIVRLVVEVLKENLGGFFLRPPVGTSTP